MPATRSKANPLSATQTFAWYGFSFAHAAEYAPAAITGTRREGYVRLASTGRVGIQVRWTSAKNPGNLRPKLTEYLNRLERDAKKAKTGFSSEFDREEDGAIGYRYTGVAQGRGRLFYSAEDGRVFFVEVVGGRKDSVLPIFRLLLDSFTASPPKSPEDWRLLNLHLRVPGRLSVEKKQLQAGRTHLVLRRPGVRVEASRWGFGNQLVDKHGLEQWARAALSMPSAAGVRHEDEGIVLVGRRLWMPIVALVAHEPEENQILAVKVTARKKEWRPDWDWLS